MAAAIVSKEAYRVSGRLATLHRVLAEAGLSFDDLQRPIDYPEMRESLVRFWRNGAIELSNSQKRARAILEGDFHDFSAYVALGIMPQKRQLDALAEIPYSKVVLQELKGQYMLFPDLGFSIAQLSCLLAKSGIGMVGQDMWGSDFVAKRGKAKWHLVKKIPVPDPHFGLCRIAYPGPGHEMPLARVLMLAAMIRYLDRGEILFPTSTKSATIAGERQPNIVAVCFRDGRIFFSLCDTIPCDLMRFGLAKSSEREDPY